MEQIVSDWRQRWAALALSGAVIGAIAGGASNYGMLGALSGKAQSPQAAAPVPPQRDAAAAQSSSTYEILAFEGPGCTYCTHFRNDIARTYSRSGYAALAPVRFVDIGTHEMSRLNLAQAVSILPTAVVLRDGVEVGRINGYVGRESFYQVLEKLIVR